MKYRVKMAAFVRGLVVLVLALWSIPALAQLDFSTKAKYAILMDYQSGTVLFQKNADARMEPASMAKLMTLAVVFDQLRQGRIKMSDDFFISERAWREGGAGSGGSTMFAKVHSKVPVSDLIRSVIVQSGNDAAIALAEGIAGTEETFARMMNDEAQRIGLKDCNFVNATGLPDPNEYMTARDLALLARYIIKTFPEYYPIFSEESFTWNKIKQDNRNSLLKDGIGVDGLKTGHTQEAGYGIVASTTAGGRRLIAVLHGLKTAQERSEEARKLVTWGSRSFQLVHAYDAGQVVGYADVYGGAESNVGLVGKGPIDLYLPKGARRCLKADIDYKGPLRPPVQKGDKVGQFNVRCNGQLIQTTPVYAARTVGRGSLTRQATDALKALLLGWL